MSGPQNNSRHSLGKPSSSHAVTGQSSGAAQPHWQGPIQGHHLSHGHVNSDPTAVTSPPPYLESYRPDGLMVSSFGFNIRQPGDHGQAHQTPNYFDSDPHSMFAHAQSHPGAINYGFQPPPPHAGAPLLPGDSNFTANGSRFGQAVPMNRSQGDERMAPHRAPPAPHTGRSIPGNTTFGPPVRSGSRRSEIVRRRQLNTPSSSAAQGARQNSRRSLFVTPETSNSPAASMNANEANSMPQSHDYHYRTFIAQNYPDSVQAPVPNMEDLFAHAFTQPFAQNPQQPGWATSPSTAMPSSSSGLQVPLDPRHLVHGSAVHGESFPGNTYDTSAPVSRSTSMNGVDRATMPSFTPAAAQPQETHNQLQQIYEYYGVPPASASGSTTDPTGAGEDLAAARARRMALLERRSRQLQNFRRGMRATNRPSPAQLKHYTTLLASDSSHDVECPICQEPYDDEKHPAIQLQNVACTHVFGRSCLQEWCNSGMDNAHKCPSCRQSIEGALDSASVRRRPRSPESRMASRTGPSSFRPDTLPRGQDEWLRDRFQRPAGYDPAQWDAHVQQLQGQLLNSTPPTHPFLAQQSGPRASGRLMGTSSQALQAPEQQLLFNRAFQRQEMSRFDANAARRIANASATGYREAHALMAQIARERAALVARQEDEQFRALHERAIREYQDNLQRE